MTVTSISKDPQALTMTVVAELAASPERAWQLWADPRQLERWWGPPACPATVIEHDLTPGGSVTYFMSLPDGTEARGWWRVRVADPPRLLEFDDGFADADGNPDPDMPVTSGRVRFEAHGDNQTRMVIESSFASTADMDRLIAMGMEDGMRQALDQMDALVADAARS